MTPLQPIISKIAGEADELLATARTPEEAKVELQDHVKSSYPKLPAADSKAVVAGVLAILNREGFFEGSRDDDGFGPEGGGGDEE